MSNQDTITAILKAHGANAAQIAGIEGNLSIETGGTFSPTSYNAAEKAEGIAQWEGDRLTGPNGLKAYAASVGKPFTDLATQVNFLIKEGGLGVVSKSTTPTQAATAFDTVYERSTLASLPDRIAAAVKIFSGGSTGGATTSAGPPSAGVVAPTASNYFTKFLQGLGIAPSAGALQALASVENYEGNNSRYNPFNVIQPEPGSTSINNVNVQSYADFDSGVQGSVALFQGSHWAGVRTALATGNATAIMQAFDSAYSWSPGTNIPLISGDKLNTELTRNVGANPGTGSTATAGSTPGTAIETAISIPGAPDWLNNLVGAGEDALTAPTKFFDLASKVYSAFINPENWLRFGLIFIGIIVLIIGVDKLADGDLVGSLSPSDSAGSIPSPQAVQPMPISETTTSTPDGSQTRHVRYRGDSSPYGSTSKSAAPKKAPAKKAPAKKAPAKKATPAKAKAATTAEVVAA